MPSYPSPVRRTPEPPGRVVATLYPLDEDASDDDSGVSEPRSSSFRSTAPVDARVYDEWTAEAEAEARDAVAAAPTTGLPPDEPSLEPRADAPPRATNPAALALVAVLGVTGAGLLAAGAAAAAGAVAAGIFGAL